MVYFFYLFIILHFSKCYEVEKLSAAEGKYRDVFVVCSTRGHCSVSLTSDWTFSRKVLTLIKYKIKYKAHTGTAMNPIPSPPRGEPKNRNRDLALCICGDSRRRYVMFSFKDKINTHAV